MADQEWTAAVMEQEVLRVLGEVQQECEAGREFGPIAFVFGNVHPKTSERWHARHDVDSRNIVMPDEWPVDRKKEEMTRVVAAIAAATKATAIIWAMEAWAVDYNEPGCAAHKVLPSQHPQRKEAVLITLEQRGAPNTQWLAFLTRPAIGHPVLGPWSKHVSQGEHQVRSRFLDLLPAVN